MLIYHIIRSGIVSAIILGLFIATTVGVIKEPIVYTGVFWWCCFIALFLVVIGRIYYFFRPPIKIHIKRLGDCRSDDLTSRGKPCIEFLIDNFGKRISLHPAIRMDYILYEWRKERLIDRLRRTIKRKQKKFEVIPASTENLNLPNGQKQLVAVCSNSVADGLVAFHVFTFSFSGGGSRRLFFFNSIKHNAIGTMRFLLSLSIYALLNRLTFLDLNKSNT